ncbi:MAG: hypothetical protein Q8O67_28520 [Deltaproteobacteria bacterium]|nr:hypothetical protein [Deltaproteobacteria bacterium]
MRLASGFVVVVVGLSALPAFALEKGDVCTLKAALMVTINRPEGKVETTLDAGTDIEVVVVGDEGRTRINTGDAKGAVATRDLEAACAGTLQMCRLTKELILFEKNRSDSRSWKIKQGAPVSVLRTGKVWAHVRVDDLEGFAKADELTPRCPLISGSDVKETGEPGATEEVERGEGPGVLLLPLILEGAAPVGTADVLLDSFFDRLAYYRPDAARLPIEGARDLNWKKHVADSAARGRGAGLAYVVVGKLAVETVADKGALVVSLALVDTASGATLKAVRARPTMKAEDTWAESTLFVLLPLMRTAPGARQPEGPKFAPQKGPKAGAVTPSTNAGSANASAGPAPWFANPWGYVALGTAAAAGVGSGVVGALANADNTAANEAPPVDDDRSTLRESALVKGIASDSLAVVAGVAVVTTIVVFASRAGMAE